MKKIFIQNQTFLLFLAKFFGAYIFFICLYQLYLQQYQSNEVDWITNNVAQLSKGLLSEISLTSLKIDGNTIQLYYKQKWVARIIEGCNAISVIILFISFIIAFTGKIKKTLFYIIIGCTLIYLINITRIVLLSVLLYHFPAQEHILHGVFFPLFIYGFVFLLWIIWVNQFSNHSNENH